jgi:O-antigen/teichoic acid export membrane protein
VLANTLATIGVRAASDGLHLLAALKQASYLGQKDWGLWGYLLSTLDLFRVATNFGLDVVAVRLMAVGTALPRAIVRSLLLLKSWLSFAGLAGVLALSFVLPRCTEHRDLLLLLALSLFPVGYLSSVTTRFQAEHRMEQLIAPQFVAGALYLASVYLGAWRGWSLPAFAVMFLGYHLLLFFLTGAAYRLCWRPAGEGPAPPPAGLSLTVLRQGVPVGALMIMGVVYSRLGIFLIERFGDLSAVGHYFIALKVSEPLLAAAGALSMSAFPVLSRLVESRNAPELRRRFILYSVRSAIITCAIAGVLTLLAPSLLRLIRPEYVGASGALIALGWATACMFQNQLSTATINSFGKYHYVTGFAAINVVSYTVLSMLLVPRLGPTGAGIATLGTEGLNALGQILCVRILLRRIERASTP